MEGLQVSQDDRYVATTGSLAGVGRRDVTRVNVLMGRKGIEEAR